MHMTAPIDLAHKKCKPCDGGVLPFTEKQAQDYLNVTSGWVLNKDGKSIRKHYKFGNFKTALDFVNAVGAVAESENHHPDIVLKWGSVDIELSTHAIKGLSENDFILAYKIDNPV